MVLPIRSICGLEMRYNGMLPYTPCLRVPKTTASFGDSQDLREDSQEVKEGSQDSAYCRTHGYDLRGGGYKAKSAKYKRPWGTIWRKPGTDFQSLLLGESHGMSFIPSATSCTKIMPVQYSARAALWRPSTGLLLGVVMELCLVRTKAQTPTRKAAVQHKPYYLYEQFRQAESFSPGNGGKSAEIQVRRGQPPANLVSRTFGGWQAFWVNSLLPSFQLHVH